MSGVTCSFPLLSPADQALYFVRTAEASLVMVSPLAADGSFDFAAMIDEFTLGGAAGEHKLLSGLASDARAIFYYDQATQRSAALFRERPNGPFYAPIDLGARRGLAPNADCSVLYSSTLVSGVSRLVRQTRLD
jgi:hypothetical protein